MEKTGIDLINEERNKQIYKHGFTGEHHYANPQWYDKNQLQIAAFLLLNVDMKTPDESFPHNWDREWFENLKQRSQKERITIAAALLASELDRLRVIEATI